MKIPGTLIIDPELSPAENFRQGQLLLIDKPLTWTSFQVVNKIRYLLKYNLGIKKIKVGHAGTLDPLASGLLVICTGKKTKQIAKLIDEQKAYTGTITLGATRPSYDMETEIDKNFPVSHIGDEQIRQAAMDFLGRQEQMPPAFSARKIGGVRAYKNARQGKSVELKSREIEVYRFDIQDIRRPANHVVEVDFLIESSKGTYIRSIAHDFGKKLNSGAYLSKLRRIKSGQFSVEQASAIDDFEQWLTGIATPSS